MADAQQTDWLSVGTGVPDGPKSSPCRSESTERQRIFGVKIDLKFQ